jgi:transcriptional regulator GlxA family with amidase domain
VRLVRGRRFVEHEHVATAAGLTSGIDLALRVVERYLGRAAADETARYMEYTRARTPGVVSWTPVARSPSGGGSSRSPQTTAR